MLNQFYGFVVVNKTGQSLTYDNGGRIKLKITPYYFASNGKVVYGTTIVEDCGFGPGDVTVDGGEDPTAEIDNSNNCYSGAIVQLEIVHDEGTLANGTYDIYYEGANVSGELPSDASGYDDAETNRLIVVDLLTWHSSGVDDEVMRTPGAVI